MRAHAAGGFDLGFALDDGDNVASDGLGDVHEHEADGAAADYGDGVADFYAGFVKSAEHAGQRLDHSRLFKADVRRNDQHVQIDDAARDFDVFGVGAVVEQQIFAKIFLMARAVEAHLAGRGIQCDNLHALLESANAGADYFDDSGEFVSEQGGRNDHAGVVAALIDLEVGAASQCDLHLDQYLAILDVGDGNLLNFHVLFTVEDGCCHLSVQCCLSCDYAD